MNIPENAQMKSLTIQGLDFQVPVVVTVDNGTLVLDDSFPVETAAAMLQQTVMENWRNNFAKKVTDVVMAAAKEAGSDATKVSEIDDETAQAIFDSIDTSDLQDSLNTYISEYVPGVRRVGTGGVSLSPVERETRKLAIEIIRDHLENEMGIGRTARSETYKAWDAQIQEEMGMSGAEYIQEMAEELIEKNPAIRETAEANIASRKAMAEKVSLTIGS